MAEERPGGFAPFRNRDFRVLFVSLIAGQAFVPLQFISGVLWIQENASEDVRIILIGLIGAIRGIGGVGFGLFAGALSDRFDRRKLVIAAQLGAVVLALATGALMWVNDATPLGLTVFFALTTVTAAFWAVDIPARQAMVPDVVGQRLAPAGISLSAAGMQVSMPVALFASGLLIDAIGFGATYSISAVGHLTAAFLLTFMRYNPERAKPTGAYSPMGTLRDVAAGIRYARSVPLAWSVIILVVTTMAIGMPAVSNLGPTWITTVAGVDVKYFGLIAMWWGIGAFTTSMVLTRVLTPSIQGRVLCGGLIVFAFSFFLFATGTIWGVVLGNIGLGCGLACTQVTSTSLVQRLVSNEVRGRVMSLLFLNMSVAQAMAFPIAIVGQAISLRALFPMLATITAINIAYTLLRRRELWRKGEIEAPSEADPVPRAGAAR
jgi:predicted MFS family arabinose efflux permease